MIDFEYQVSKAIRDLVPLAVASFDAGRQADPAGGVKAADQNGAGVWTGEKEIAYRRIILVFRWLVL